MYIGSLNRLRVEEQALKRVICEKCGCDYIYLLERHADGYAFSLIGLIPLGCPEESAKEQLIELIQSGVDVAPCPNCNHLQDSMIAQAKREYLSGISVFGKYFACGVGAVFGAIGLILWANDETEGGYKSLIIAGLGIVIGLAFILLRKILSLYYDPTVYIDQYISKMNGKLWRVDEVCQYIPGLDIDSMAYSN